MHFKVGVSSPVDLQHVSGSRTLDEDVEAADGKHAKQQERNAEASEHLTGNFEPA